MAEYGTVAEPWWSHKGVAIVAGGPSLKDFDFERLRGLHVLAVKGSIFDIPWADAGFGADVQRFQEWQDKLAGLPTRVYWSVWPDKVKAMPAADNITYLERVEGAEISTDPGKIFDGGTSGFGALQIAALKKATRIGLFGFDYNAPAFGADPKDFRHNDKHYTKKRQQEAASWAMWAGYFDKVEWVFRQRNINVVNACPMSSVNAFQKVTIDDAVEYLHRL